MNAGILVQMLQALVLLFLQIHAPVSLGEKLFSVIAILGIEGTANAEREPILAAYLTSCYPGKFAQTHAARFGCVCAQPWRDDHKFIASHAGNVVILSARTLQGLGE